MPERSSRNSKEKKRKLRRGPKLKSSRKTGHLYSDFNRFLEENDCSVVQMDCVEGKRTNLFFCEPNRSDQKGQCKNNHKLIRNILPQGTSFKKLTRKETLTIMNHINRYTGKSFFGKKPYDMAINTLPKEFFTKLDLEKIRS